MSALLDSYRGIDMFEPHHFAAAAGGRARILTVASGKGGVGKTHLSVNLAASLVEAGQRVLLIDGDLGLANVNVMLGVSPRMHAGHLLDGTQSFEQVVLPLEERLHLLPAGSALVRLAELDLPAQVRLLESLDLAHRPYDFVLIDAGAGIGGNVRLSVSMADEVLVVMNPEMTSLTDAYALVKVAHAIGFKGRFEVVVNRVRLASQARDMFTSLDSAARSFLSVELGYAGYVYRDRVVERALRAQSPFVRSFPDAPASRCVAALARRLIAPGERVAEEREARPAQGA